MTAKHFPYWQLVLPFLPLSAAKRSMPAVHYMQEVSPRNSERAAIPGFRYASALTCHPLQLGTRLVTGLIDQRAREGRSDEEYQEGTGAIFECLLKPNPKKQFPAPDLNGLVQDACAFLVGGSDTTGLTLQAVTLFVLRNPAVHSRLRTELDGAAGFIRHDFDMHQVSKLPWLVYDRLPHAACPC